MQLKSKGIALASGLMLSFLSVGLAHSQTDLQVTRIDNSVENFAVAPAGKFLFSGSNLIIHIDGSATPTTIPLSDIRKITFDNGSTHIDNTEISKSEIVLYPNPTDQFFTINAPNLNQFTVRIFNTQGREVLSGTYENGSKIDISLFTSGIYIVVINQQSFKLFKQ